MYVEIPFWRLLLALAVVSLPAALLDQGGERKAARAYVLLIVLMFLVANWSGVIAAERWVRRELR